MTTQTKNDKPKHERPTPSLMQYHEDAQWKVGHDIITIVGGAEKKPIAFIRLERYDDNKKPVFSTRDLDGNPLSEESSNLYELKKNLKDKEIALTKAMQDKEQPQQTIAEVEPATPVQNQQAPVAQKTDELKKVRRTRTVKQKDNEQTISH